MKRFLLFFVLIVLCLGLHAQSLPVNIESLSDEQLLQLATKYQLVGLSDAELEAKAKEAGLSTDQILLLKKRLSLLDQSGSSPTTAYNNKTDSYVQRTRVLTKGPGIRAKDSTGALGLFGADIFDNTDLSFEPNLSIATPQQYILGVNDQLVIDVYGVSDITKKLKITTEGDIRYPNYGPIKVAGLSIEDARIKIRQSLTKIYPGLATGKVSVQVSLGQVRSIQVTLLGEVRRPGTYTISSLATLMNALYASGGPNDIGSFRKIELLRGGKAVAVFDLYDFLLKGDLRNNLMLRDDDVIKVSPYETRVALKGALKKPAIFDMKAGESAADLVRYAGGFADIAFKERVRITRLGLANREILTVPVSELGAFKLLSGDTLTVDSLTGIYANRVLVTGAVYHPGAYGIQQIGTLKALMAAVQPAEGAYLERAILRRLKPDMTPSFINFSVQDVLKGSFDLKLEREDSIHLFKSSELKERYTVDVNGEVNLPGTYTYYENMSVQDLVLLANGFRESASKQKIEVSRRLRTHVADKDTLMYAVIREINLDQAADLAFTLQPYDVVSVRKSPMYKSQINVSVEGEVLFPGNYSLAANNERLSDIVKRAGGLKASAFTDGAVLVRNTYVGISNSDAALLSTKAQLINQQSGKAIVPNATADSSLVKQYADQQKLVSIRLADALRNPGSASDVFLEEGDVLKVPKTIQTIQTFGMVNVPKQIVFREGISLREAVRESGGFAVNASRKHAYVVYANGEVRTTKRFLFFKSYPSIKTGAEIYVPAKREGRKLTTGETVGLISSLTSLLGLVVVLINTSK